MTSRPTVAAAGSLVAFALIVAALYWRTAEAPTGRALVVYVAPTSRLPMQASARDYETATGQRVELRFGPSEDILTKAGMANPSDLFLPADESYVVLARERGLVGEQFPLAELRAVVLCATGNPKRIAAWPDLLRDGVKVAVPNPGAAVGKVARAHLAANGRWWALQPHAVDTGTVTEAANAAKVGSVDAAVVWDAVAVGYPGQKVLPLPELAGATARVEVAVLTQSPDPAAARRFARYLTAPDGGLAHFRAARFRVIEPRGGKK